MKQEIIKKIRQELFKEDLYKKRKDCLVNEYIDICTKIKDRIYSKEDLEFIKKNQGVINMQEKISIPAVFYNYIERKYIDDTPFNVEVDFPSLGINFPCSYYDINNCFLEEFLTEEERNSLRNVCVKIKELGEEYTNRSMEICSNIPHKITVSNLRDNFPEAYNIYIRLSRRNGKLEE